MTTENEAWKASLIQAIDDHFEDIEAKDHGVQGIALAISHFDAATGRQEVAHTVVIQDGRLLPLIGAVEVLRVEVFDHVELTRYLDRKPHP